MKKQIPRGEQASTRELAHYMVYAALRLDDLDKENEKLRKELAELKEAMKLER